MKSFSATDYKGTDVKGTVIYEDAAQSFCLVDEDSFPGPPTLWIVDKLDDVGISLDVEQVTNHPTLHEKVGWVRCLSFAGVTGGRREYGRSARLRGTTGSNPCQATALRSGASSAPAD